MLEPILFLVGLVVLVVGGGAWLHRAARERFRRRASDVARALDLQRTFGSAASENEMAAGEVYAGLVHGVRVEVRAGLRVVDSPLAPGPIPLARNEVELWLAPPAPHVFEIAQRGAMERGRVITGDRAFDARCRVDASEPEAVAAWLSPPLRAAILAVYERKYTVVTMTHERLRVASFGREALLPLVTQLVALARRMSEHARAEMLRAPRRG